MPNNPLDEVVLGFQRGNDINSPEVEGFCGSRNIVNVHRSYRGGDDIAVPVINRIMDEANVDLVGVNNFFPVSSILPCFPLFVLNLR